MQILRINVNNNVPVMICCHVLYSDLYRIVFVEASEHTYQEFAFVKSCTMYLLFVKKCSAALGHAQ